MTKNPPDALLDADAYASFLGVRLVDAEPDRVRVELVVEERHLDRSGRVAPEVLFSLADCAMSLISNADATAVAVAAHLVPGADPEVGEPLVAEARPLVAAGDRNTWRVTVEGRSGRRVAVFTGTTLRV